MVQITIDDILAEYEIYNVGDVVRVSGSPNGNDPESYYYLKDFHGKEGKILEVIEKPRLQYRVGFRNGEGYFYHEELRRD